MEIEPIIEWHKYLASLGQNSRKALNLNSSLFEISAHYGSFALCSIYFALNSIT